MPTFRRGEAAHLAAVAANERRVTYNDQVQYKVCHWVTLMYKFIREEWLEIAGAKYNILSCLFFFFKRNFEPSAPATESKDDATKCWNSPAPPTTPATGVRRHFSNASSVPNRYYQYGPLQCFSFNCSVAIVSYRPHFFVEKRVVVKDVCSVCSRRIGFRKMHYKCRDCAIVSHIECR